MTEYKVNQNFEPIQNLKKIINFKDQSISFEKRSRMALELIVALIRRSSKW